MVQVVVPLLAALLALAWPAWQQFQRRRTFTRLVRAELLKAAPQPRSRGDDHSQWTSHLTRRFLHDKLLEDPTGNHDFVLSLDPRLSCDLAQLWINFRAAGDSDDVDTASRWCSYLEGSCRQLDRRRRSKRLTNEVWQPWHDLLIEYHPPGIDGDGGHDHPAGDLHPSPPTARQVRR